MWFAWCLFWNLPPLLPAASWSIGSVCWRLRCWWSCSSWWWSCSSWWWACLSLWWSCSSPRWPCSIAHHQDEHAYLGDDFAPNILWLSCGNDPCDTGLIVILDTTWPIAYCLCWSWWWLQLFCDCHVAMILARVAWLWFWLQLGLLPTNKMDQTSRTRPTQNRKRKK